MTKKHKKRTSRHPVIRFLKYKIFHIEDSPHKIALGVAIGILIVPSPLLGLHIIMVIGLCLLLKANKLAALVSTFANNLFTVVPIFYVSYFVGSAVLSLFMETQSISKEQLTQMLAPGSFMAGFYRLEYWQGFWEFLKQIGLELWVGSFITGGVSAVLSYIACFYIVRHHRAKSPHRRYANYQ